MTDFGKVQVPTKWDDIKLAQFQEILRIYELKENDPIAIISILSGVDKETLRLMPTEFIETLMAHLQFMNTKLEVKPSNKIEIDGKEYIVNYLEKLKFGEFVDVETLMKNDKYDYASFLAILCRLKGEIYDDTFIAEKFDDRVKMFEELSLPKALVLINFFLQLRIKLLACTPKSLENSKQAVSQFLQSIKSSLKNGHGSKWNMICAKIKLHRLEKLLRHI